MACERCRDGFTTSISGATKVGDCSLPICEMGLYLNSYLLRVELRYEPFSQIGNEQSQTLVAPAIEVVKPSGQRS